MKSIITKRLRQLLIPCVSILALCLPLFAVYATESTGSTASSEHTVTSAPPSASDSTSVNDDSESTVILSSEPLSSEESSEQRESSKVTSSSTSSRQDAQSDTTPIIDNDSNNSGGRGTIILAFCYIIAALIGLCLIGMIVANIYIPIANKKRELQANDDQFDDNVRSYDIGDSGSNYRNDDRPRGRR